PTEPALPALGQSIERGAREIVNPLGIDRNFASVIPRKPLDKIRNDALSAVSPVKERRNDHKSRRIACSRRARFRLSQGSLRGARAAAGRRGYQPAATG